MFFVVMSQYATVSYLNHKVYNLLNGMGKNGLLIHFKTTTKYIFPFY